MIMLKAILAILIMDSTTSYELRLNCYEWLSAKNVQFIVDYVEWRKISRLVILDENLDLGN